MSSLDLKSNWKLIAVTSLIAVTVTVLVYGKLSKRKSNMGAQSSVADKISKKSSSAATSKAGNTAPAEATYPTPKQQSEAVPRTGAFNPGLIISKGVSSKPNELPKVEQMGDITLEELNKYGCTNPDRRLLSLFGTVFDVTHAVSKYGAEGSYRDFAGHDITLCLGSGKLETKWLDKFVLMTDKHIESAQGWVEFYETQYPKCGKLSKWEEDQSQWPNLTEEDLEELNAECIIM